MLMFHWCLLFVAQLVTLVCISAAGTSRWLAGSDAVGHAPTSTIGSKTRIGAATRVGRSRVRRRRNTSCVPRYALRANCRRAEAWLLAYLLVSAHVFPRAGNRGVHAEGEKPRDERSIPPDGRLGVAGDAVPVRSSTCWRDHDSVISDLPGVGPQCQRVLEVHKGWWTKAVRIGEARNPGPLAATVAVGGLLRRLHANVSGAIVYPRPGTGSLRGAIAPGFARDGTGGPTEEQFELKIEAVNTTGWKSLQRRLLTTHAHALLAQETWVTQDSIPAASDWARKRGWKSVWSAAQAGPNGGAAGGGGHLGAR